MTRTDRDRWLALGLLLAVLVLLYALVLHPLFVAPLRLAEARIEDLQAYERIISRTVPLAQRFVQLWTGEPGYADGFGKPAQLPASFLIDKSGRIVERYQGRIPAEAWDRIAELL